MYKDQIFITLLSQTTRVTVSIPWPVSHNSTANSSAMVLMINTVDQSHALIDKALSDTKIGNCNGIVAFGAQESRC